MIGNYFTLLNIARSIHNRCAGQTISEIYSQQKQQLCVVVETRPVSTMIVSCVPSQQYLCLRVGNFRARRNSVDLFPEAKGRRVLGVSCDPDDRVVVISMEENFRMECELFGSRANVHLWKRAEDDLNESLVGSFLGKKERDDFRRPVKSPVSSPSYQNLLRSGEAFTGAMRAGSDENILRSLKRTIPVLGSILAEEILLRAEIESDRATERVTDEELGRLRTAAYALVDELTSADGKRGAVIYSEEGEAVCFSLVELRSRARMDAERFDDISEAIQRYVGMRHSASKLDDEKGTLQSWIEKESGKVERVLSKIAQERGESDRAALYELTGKVITANLHLLRNGLSDVRLENPFASGENEREMRIQLDPALSPAANAERYFDKAKKSRVASQEAAERVATLNRRSGALKALEEELAGITSNDSLKEFIQLKKDELRELGFLTEKEKEDLPPFRIFTVEGGFQVMAGKSSENNDLLTMKYAKPNDLWFHCRGSSGSHVILRMKSAPGEPSRGAIRAAASIAAYYSKMKNATSVPVVVTEKKYVHKPKGAPPGTVTLDREKVLFVEPKLPPSHS